MAPAFQISAIKSGAVAAVHRDARTGDEAGVLAREKCDGRADFFRTAEAAQRGARFCGVANSLVAGFMSVSIGPGSTTLTVIPFGPRSRAQPRVYADTAPLVAE